MSNRIHREVSRVVGLLPLLIVWLASPLAADQGATAGADSLLFVSQQDRYRAFRTIHHHYPTRIVEAGRRPYPLGDAPRDLSAVRYSVDGRTHTLEEFLAMPETTGFIVVQDGEVALEHYGAGNDRDTLWVSFSVTKSVTSLLIGAAIQDGYIGSVDEPVVHYLPRLRGTGYAAASIEDVMQMASGVAWNEDYADPSSDVARAGGVNGLELTRYLAGLPRVHAPGEVFNYNTGETNLAGEILRAAIGNNASTYLEHKIWRPFGMGADATWMLGAEGGAENGGCCISATLRDYARLGIFAMRGGRLADGTAVLPPGWMEASTAPSEGNPGYGYLWWLADGDDAAYAAVGVFAQRIFVDPDAQLVVAAHGNAPTAVDSLYHRHQYAAIGAVRAALR